MAISDEKLKFIRSQIDKDPATTGKAILELVRNKFGQGVTRLDLYQARREILQEKGIKVGKKARVRLEAGRVVSLPPPKEPPRAVLDRTFVNALAQGIISQAIDSGIKKLSLEVREGGTVEISLQFHGDL